MTAGHAEPGPVYVKSTATGTTAVDGYGFRGWRYATVDAQLTRDGKKNLICLDTGCTMTLINRQFLKEYAPTSEIKRMASPITVRGLGANTHESNEFAIVDLHLPGKNGRVTVISREAHLVENLKARMLIGMDILAPEAISLNLSGRTAVIGSCDDIEIPLTITTSSPDQTNQLVLFKK